MSENDQLKARIAELAGRLNREKQRQAGILPDTYNSQHTGYQNHYYPTRGSTYQRGVRKRIQPTFRNKTLVLQPSKVAQAQTNTSFGGHQPSTLGSVQSTGAPSDTSSSPQWYKKTGRHKQLINVSVLSKSGANSPTQHAATGTGSGTDTGSAYSEQVVIDGIVFRSEYNGNRLVRITQSAQPSPKTAEVNGSSYHRSRNGNLYRSTLVVKIQATFDWIYTGVCTRGSGCRHVHDPTKVAICKDFLNGRDCRAGSMCDLSHEPSPHRSPACLHYLRGYCTNDNCRYTHVNVSPEAPICRPFATIGYCEKGGYECENRHVTECPDYSATGTCRNRRCRLPHIDRAGQLRKAAGVVQPSGQSASLEAGGDTSDESDDEESIDSGDDVSIMLGVPSDDDEDLDTQQDYVPL